ncbi:hypothetical protein F2P81_019700 [Scophthalmus maximus]|uniref:Uncharacterized protein n=1 Tax=Scophthalmus maximus TaxID=52904 RepID=A0A6A4S2N4_SCOMX|nr:hypothetical protein F2P81_019700 [Scophthalmus maximus]
MIAPRQSDSGLSDNFEPSFSLEVSSHVPSFNAEKNSPLVKLHGGNSSVSGETVILLTAFLKYQLLGSRPPPSKRCYWSFAVLPLDSRTSLIGRRPVNHRCSCGRRRRGGSSQGNRELVLLFSDVLASPALDSFTHITVVVAVLSDDEQLPAPPPPPRPVRPSRGSQPPAWTPLSQQVEAQGLLGNGGRFGSRLTQSQGCRGVRAWPSSSSSSSHVSISFPDPSDQQSAPSLSSSFSSSSFVRHFQSASSLTSSSVLPPPPPPPPTQTSMNAAPRLVPIFKNKQPSRHVNVALLRVQRTEEEEGRRRLTLPPSRKNRPTSSPLPLPDSSSSSSLASLPIPPPPIIPRFNCRRGPHSGATPTRPARPKIRRMSSLSPASKSGPGLLLLLAPNTEMKHGRAKSGSKTHVKLGTVSESVTDSGRKLQEKATEQPSAALPETPPPPPPPTSCDKDTTSTSGGAGVVFECKPKKSRVAVRDVDVEKMARSNQLFRVNSATLLVWLRGRGVSVSGKHKKDELMLKSLSLLFMWTYKGKREDKRVPDSRGQRQESASSHTRCVSPGLRP